MNLTKEQYVELLSRPAIARLNSAGGKAQGAKLECAIQHEPLAKAEGKAGNATRFRVSVEGRRTRLLDPDNLAPKYFIDCCRYAGLIPDDSARFIDLTVTQTKVTTKAEEVTIITIVPL